MYYNNNYIILYYNNYKNKYKKLYYNKTVL